jgi:hypothetical protein
MEVDVNVSVISVNRVAVSYMTHLMTSLNGLHTVPLNMVTCVCVFTMLLICIQSRWQLTRYDY